MKSDSNLHRFWNDFRVILVCGLYSKGMDASRKAPQDSWLTCGPGGVNNTYSHAYRHVVYA
eukprot:1369929-Amorphochlora_amoeboformis.AAC.2